MIAFLIALVVFLSPTQAHAYLDPGTGSMLLQGIIAGIAAGITFVSLFFARIKMKFVGLFQNRSENSSK